MRKGEEECGFWYLSPAVCFELLTKRVITCQGDMTVNALVSERLRE